MLTRKRGGLYNQSVKVLIATLMHANTGQHLRGTDLHCYSIYDIFSMQAIVNAL